MSGRSKAVLKRAGSSTAALKDDANEQWANRVLSHGIGTVCRSQSLLSPPANHTRKDSPQALQSPLSDGHGGQIRRSSSVGSNRTLLSRSPSPIIPFNIAAESPHSSPSQPSKLRPLQNPPRRFSQQAQCSEGEKSSCLQPSSMSRRGHTVARPSTAPSRRSDSMPEKGRGPVKPIAGGYRNTPGNIPGNEITDHDKVKMQLMVEDAKLPGIMTKQEHRLMVMTGQQRKLPRPCSAPVGEHRRSDAQATANRLLNKKQTLSTAATEQENMHPNVSTRTKKLAEMKPLVPGFPTTSEVLERGQLGWFGWPLAERVRVKRACTRYSLPGRQEVSRENLGDVILHLGYFQFSEGTVNELAQKVSGEQAFNISDVVAVVEHFAERERAEITAAASALYDTVERNEELQLDRDKLVELLHNLGAYPLQDTISEILDMAKIAITTRTLTIVDVVKVLAAYRAVEGLSKADIHHIKTIFESHAVKHTNDAEVEYEIPFDQLSSVLLEIQNRYALDGVRSLLQKVPSYSARCRGLLGTQSTSCPPGVTLHELCIWARRLRDFVIEHLLDGFRVGDLDETDCVSNDELGTLIQNEGFTLVRPAMDEFLAEANCDPDKPLNFADYVKFVMVCQAHEGFREHQRNEFQAIFSKYDHDQSGSLNRSTICDLLTYFYGCGIQAQEINRAIDEVDFDLSGTMEFGEFLSLMRMFAEMEYQRARVAFELHSDTFTDMLPASHVVKALGSMGVTLVQSVRESVEQTIREDIDLEMFMDVVERYRKLNVIELRKQASFSNDEFAYMRSRFDECRASDSDCIDEGRLLWLVMSLGYPCDTADQRKCVVGMIHKAWAQALNAGCCSSEMAQRGRINFLCFVHLVRLLASKQEASRETCEDVVIKETEFSVSDVIEFRKIFTEWTRSSKLQSKKAVPSNVDSACGKTTAEQTTAISPMLVTIRKDNRLLGRTSSLPAIRRQSSRAVQASTSQNLQSRHASLGDACQPILASDAADKPAARLKALLSCTSEQLPAESLLKCLRKSGLGHLKDNDWHKICDYIGGSSASLDFAAFLRLMRWMITCGIDGITERRRTKHTKDQAK